MCGSSKINTSSPHLSSLTPPAFLHFVRLRVPFISLFYSTVPTSIFNKARPKIQKKERKSGREKRDTATFESFSPQLAYMAVWPENVFYSLRRPFSQTVTVGHITMISTCTTLGSDTVNRFQWAVANVDWRKGQVEQNMESRVGTQLGLPPTPRPSSQSLVICSSFLSWIC